MGRDELLVWWYDFHNLIFILYNDKILFCLLMARRRKIKPWDPSILGNDRFQKGQETFGSLQRRHGDSRILLIYLNWIDNFVRRSGNQKNDYDQSGATETWWKYLQHSVVLLLEDKQTWEGRTVISPHFDCQKC